MKTQTIEIPFIATNETKYQEISDILKIDGVIIGIKIELPRENSVMLSFELVASPLDHLPFEATFSFHSDSGFIFDTERTIKFYKNFPSQSVSCLFTFKKNSLLESLGKFMDLTIEKKTNSEIKATLQPEDNQNNFPSSIFQFLSNNSRVTQNDIDTIKKDMQIINSPTLNPANNNFIDDKKYSNKEKFDLPISNIYTPNIINQQQQKQNSQPNPIQNHTFTVNTSNFSSSKNRYNGLLNQGATCYLNATIQSLFHIPFFRNVIFQYESDDGRNDQIIDSLQKLFYNLEHGSYSCSTNSFTSSLHMDQQAIFTQQDAQEFLIHFTETLENILKKDKEQKDKISYIFGGKTIQTVQNDRHQIISSHEENIFELIIGLSDSVKSSLSNLIRKETIDDYNDDKTKTVQTVSMQTKLLKLPRILRLLIKRYRLDKTLNSFYKDNSRMSFEDELDLAPYVYNKDQCGCTKYKLYSVIVHQGQIGVGHYYSYIKPEMNDDWYLFNDSFVNHSNMKDAIENNFGNDVNNNNVFDIQSYSAYILFYVRVDSIDEMFMKSRSKPKPKPNQQQQEVVIEEEEEDKEEQEKISIPRHVSDEAEEENLKNLHRVKNDSLCQIAINIYNELCLIENCKKGIPSFFNNEYMFEIPVDLRSKSIEIYEKVSELTKLNKNCIRLWTLNNNYQQLINVVDPETQINQLGAQNLFLEIKKENEKLNDIENPQIYFIVLYTKLISSPFLYLKAGHYKIEQKSIGGFTIPFKYESIIDDVLSTTINPKLLTTFSKNDMKVFLSNSTKIEKKISFAECSADNGSVIVMQINEKKFVPDDSIIENLEKLIGIKEKLRFIKKNEINENQNQSNTISYFDLMVNELPNSPDVFIENKNEAKFVKVYNFNDISKIEGTIEIPLKIRTTELIKFIELAFSIDNFNDKNECILLFARDPNSEMPRSKPIEKFCSPFKMENIDTIYYCIAPISFSRNSSSKTRVIQLSENGYSVSKTVCYYMPDNETHPFEQFRLMNDQLFGENVYTRMFIIHNNEFGLPIVDDHEIDIDNNNILRIEKVSDDQISSDLILIQKARVGKYNKIETLGDPFYFAYVEDEPISLFRNRIKKFFGKDESFKVHKKRNYYNDSNVMNVSIKIEKWEKVKALYLIYENDLDHSGKKY